MSKKTEERVRAEIRAKVLRREKKQQEGKEKRRAAKIKQKEEARRRRTLLVGPKVIIPTDKNTEFVSRLQSHFHKK